MWKFLRLLAGEGTKDLCCVDQCDCEEGWYSLSFLLINAGGKGWHPHAGGIITGGGGKGSQEEGNGIAEGGGPKKGCWAAGSSGGAKDDLGGGITVTAESAESVSSSLTFSIFLMIRIFSIFFFLGATTSARTFFCRESDSSSEAPPQARSRLFFKTRSKALGLQLTKIF